MKHLLQIIKCFSHQWLGPYIISFLPVLLVCYVTCHYEQAERLLPLFFIEWTLVVVAFFLLCPWLGGKGVAIAAVPFLLSFCVSAMVVHDSIATHNAVWQWSDDWWYLQRAGDVVDILRASNWDLFHGWLDFLSTTDARWSLAGWPFLLGLVTSFFPQEGSLGLYHAVALSLNATFLTLVLALIYTLFQEPARRFPWVVLLCFVLLIGDPIVYAGMSRKESMLQFFLMLSFVSLYKIKIKYSFLWVVMGVVGLSGIITTRPIYIVVLAVICFITQTDKIRLNVALKVTLLAIIVFISYSFLMNFGIRGIPLRQILVFHHLEAIPGIGMTIYNLPLIGPFIYYIVSPLPAWPSNIINSSHPFTTIIRSIGSALYVSATIYVLIGFIRHPKLLKHDLLKVVLIMFCAVLLTVVLYGNDPRYKQPTNFYLSIMLFYVWYNKKIGRISILHRLLRAQQNMEMPKVNGKGRCIPNDKQKP